MDKPKKYNKGQVVIKNKKLNIKKVNKILESKKDVTTSLAVLFNDCRNGKVKRKTAPTYFEFKMEERRLREELTAIKRNNLNDDSKTVKQKEINATIKAMKCILL